MTVMSQKIDALRGVAIGSVLLYHLQTIGTFSAIGTPAPIEQIFKNGWAGVDLFFVLSAFLLTRNLDSNRDRENVVSTFYRRRILRILPLYLLVLFAGFVLEAAWTSSGGGKTWLWTGAYPGWVYASFLQNIWAGLEGGWNGHFYAPTWSLAVEEHFYLVLPFLALTLSRRGLAGLAVAFIVTAPVMRYFVHLHVNEVAAYAWTFCRLDTFGWGMLLALASRHRPEWITQIKPAIVVILLVVMAAAFLARGAAAEFAVKMSYVAVCAAMLARLAIAQQDQASSSALVRVLAWMGQRCFSLYLLHMPVIGLTFLALGARQPAAFDVMSAIIAFCALGLTLLVSDFTHRFVEKPFMNYADRNIRLVPRQA